MFWYSIAMKTIFKIALIFLALTGASTILYNYTSVEFGKNHAATAVKPADHHALPPEQLA